LLSNAEVKGFRCIGGQVWSDFSNPIRTCHDLELTISKRWNPEKADYLVAGCHCPPDRYNNTVMYFDPWIRQRCVTASECPCYDEASDTFVPSGVTLPRDDCSIWYVCAFISFPIALHRNNERDG